MRKLMLALALLSAFGVFALSGCDNSSGDKPVDPTAAVTSPDVSANGTNATTAK